MSQCPNLTLPAQDEPYPDAPALATAAWKGQVEKVKKLVKDGADLNQRGQDPDSKGPSPDAPLVFAISKVRCRQLVACKSRALQAGMYQRYSAAVI